MVPIPRLMSGHRNVLWPSLFNSFRNWLQVNFIIRPHFDKEFEVENFVKGARQAFIIVSNSLAEGKTGTLKGMVGDEALRNVERTLPKMTDTNRQKFALKESDIYLEFGWQIGIIMPNKPPGSRWVEIMMVFHCLKNFQELKHSNISVNELNDQHENFLFANCRFSRNYSKDIKPEDSSWIINYLNYFTREINQAEEDGEKGT